MTINKMGISKKWKDNGYWASKQFYWQSLMYYFYHSARFRSITFFSAANPSLHLGGMLDDAKSDAYYLMADKYFPTTLIYNPSQDLNAQIERHSISFPVIVKPDIGLKGYAVKECEDMDALITYLNRLDKDRSWLIQEFIKKEKEYSIMYYRLPQSKGYGISSVCRKEYPYVIGDGKSSLRSLINNYNNDYIDKADLIEVWDHCLDEVPLNGYKFILHHIGNYSRGSSFYSEVDAIDQELIEAIHQVFADEEGISFCRFDLKSDSLADIRKGDFKIIEVNGAKGEPIHIYDPSFTFMKRWKDIRSHWKILISIIDQRRKVEHYQFPTTKQGLRSLIAIKQLIK